jgi:hypothetical protein
MDQDRVEARCLAFLIVNDITDSAVIEPECLATIRKGELNRFNGRLERRNEDGLVISTQKLTTCKSKKLRKSVLLLFK